MKIVKSIIWVLIALGVVSLVFLPPRLVKINKLSCQSQIGACDNFLTHELSPVIGKSIYSSEKEVKKILSSEVLVQNYTVQFNLPATLKVDLILRKPVYALKSSTGSFVLIDAEGFVIAKVGNTNLPFVQIGDNLPNPGDKLDDRLNFALGLSKDMSFLYPGTAATIVNESLEVKLSEGPTVIFPLDGDRELLVGSARFVISKLMTGQENLRIDNIAQIDLRFKNPVLR